MIKFDEQYNRDNFLDFLNNFLPKDFTQKEKNIILEKDRFKKVITVKELGFCESLDLYVLEIDHNSETDPRIAIATDAFKILAQYWAHKALVIFKNKDSENYRFSYLTITLDLNDKNKPIKKYSNAHRYSFYLGPNAKINTPTKFLINKGKVADLEDLKNRFSVEVVNKEFYKEISQSFTKLVGGVLELPSTQDKSQSSLEFAVRLIGRIIFCWFLREKRSQTGHALIPKELLSFDAINKNDDYYHKILEPIFFEILNKPVKSRRDNFAKEPFSSVPYLNGGLFSPQDDDYYQRSNADFQSQYHNTLVISDNWFRDFFEILETYNFTIDENTSYDEELSIDPEMLGRIFENLLAEINPETGESARKSTGSYYTPRAIVEYMVDESLCQYLKDKTAIDEEKIRSLISYDLNDDKENPLSHNEEEKIIEALSRIKILDPACGSGAFPIGALQKIIFMLQRIDPDAQLWYKFQLEGAAPEIKRVVEREFEHKNFDYIRKLGIIRESIYGVDIQPIATEIARLRCFLTLIVDERTADDEPNRGVEPLPNLDFKFVTANTLVGLPSNQTNNQIGLFEDQEGIKQLKQVRDAYFNASGAEREQLKLKFVQIQNKMFQRMILEHTHAELTQKLSSWDPFGHDAATWFDMDWMFGIKDGFDIVIANPPYVSIQGIHWNERRYFEKHYKTAKGRFDLYILFIEVAMYILSPAGSLTYIIPKKYVNNLHFNLSRKMLLESGNVKVTFIDKNVFDASVDNIILSQMKNNNSHKKYESCLFSEGKEALNSTFDERNIKEDNYIFKIGLTTDNPIIKKIEEDSIPLKKICEVKDGIIAGEVKDLLFLQEPLDKYSKPLLFGKDVNKYYMNKPSRYINYKPEEMMRVEVERKKGKRYGLWMRTPGIFERPKILTRQVGDRIIGTIDYNNYYYEHTLHSTALKDGSFDLKYILSLFNSTLFEYFYQYKNSQSGKTFPQIRISSLEKLPIKISSKLKQKPLIEIVDKILATTQSGSYLSDEEKLLKVDEYIKQVDQLVYKLYGLTPEEMAIVEGN